MTTIEEKVLALEEALEFERATRLKTLSSLVEQNLLIAALNAKLDRHIERYERRHFG